MSQSFAIPAAISCSATVGREPVDRRAGVGREEDPVGVAALEQRERRRLALVVGQVHLEAVAVEADPDALLDQALDVVEVVGCRR